MDFTVVCTNPDCKLVHVERTVSGINLTNQVVMAGHFYCGACQLKLEMERVL